MADHPDGIYQYTSVNIPAGVTVTFIPSAKNTPVVWLVQNNCQIDGTVDLSGQDGNESQGGLGGPGGWRGGSVYQDGPTNGQGPGGGGAGASGAPGGYGTTSATSGGAPGSSYGNNFLIPLLGGSGGGAGGCPTCVANCGGGGGGGAILIAASAISINGVLTLKGGASGKHYYWILDYYMGGGGSGGGVRLFAASISGSGSINTSGGFGDNSGSATGGLGRVRFDTYDVSFTGAINGVFTQGFQPIIIPTAGQGAQLAITSVGGVPVSASPTGGITTPDAVLSAQQNNPISVVVQCSNIPLNTQITVSVNPVTGAAVSATGLNSTGTLASSIATISINIPRGGGIICASAAN